MSARSPGAKTCSARSALSKSTARPAVTCQSRSLVAASIVSAPMIADGGCRVCGRIPHSSSGVRYRSTMPAGVGLSGCAAQMLRRSDVARPRSSDSTTAATPRPAGLAMPDLVSNVRARRSSEDRSRSYGARRAHTGVQPALARSAAKRATCRLPRTVFRISGDEAARLRTSRRSGADGSGTGAASRARNIVITPRLSSPARRPKGLPWHTHTHHKHQPPPAAYDSRQAVVRPCQLSLRAVEGSAVSNQRLSATSFPSESGIDRAGIKS